jgi:hypothetical protein
VTFGTGNGAGPLTTANTAMPHRTRWQWLPRNHSWPFVLFFAGFPLWWLMGFGVLGFLLMAVPLAYFLLRRWVVQVPHGFGIWLLFLAVAVIGVVVLWIPIPGLMQEEGAGRIFPWAYRMAWFLAATVAMLYIGNTTEQELPRKRIVLLMAWMFVITVAGGYAGQFLYRLEFPSLMEVILPSPLASNAFLASLIHPGLAQLQDILGYENPRPKAPFEYANSWGANFGMFLPFFVLSHTYLRTWWQRSLWAVVLVAAVPPAIFSLNRALWIGLGVLLVAAGLRTALRGKLLMVAVLASGAVAGLVALVLTPLGQLVEARLDNPHSDRARSNLSGLSLQTVLENSPVIGFGAPRTRQNNFQSIAAGATPDCSQCSPPQLGTQGALWYLVFCTGVLGLLLFLWFVLWRYMPTLRTRDRESGAMLYVCLYFLCVLPFYDSISAPFMTLMIGMGLVWRRELEQRPASPALRKTGPKSQPEEALS